MRIIHVATVAVLLASLAHSGEARAEQFPGNGQIGFGGPIGNTVLTITRNADQLLFRLDRGLAVPLSEVLVLYFDSRDGGYPGTQDIDDQADESRRAISGDGSLGACDLTFGFDADFAVAFSADTGGLLYELQTGEDHTLIFRAVLGGAASLPDDLVFEFATDCADLELVPGAGFAFAGTYLSVSTVYRSNEGFGEGLPTLNPGTPSSVAFTGHFVMAPATIGWCNLQWPPTLVATAGVASDLVYGQVWIDDVTNLSGATAGLDAELGFGPDGSNPAVDPSPWQWVPAVFHLDVGENDEVLARLTVPAAGVYDYAYRFSFLSGPWLYGDLNGTEDGYSPAEAGSLVATAPTGVPGAPAALRLHPNQPNPFNPRTTIRFDLPVAGQAILSIYDLAGRLVRVLVEGERAAGAYEAVWDGRDATGRSAPSGSYLARLVAGGKVEVVRMGLVR